MTYMHINHFSLDSLPWQWHMSIIQFQPDDDDGDDDDRWQIAAGNGSQVSGNRCQKSLFPLCPLLLFLSLSGNLPLFHFSSAGRWVDHGSVEVEFWATDEPLIDVDQTLCQKSLFPSWPHPLCPLSTNSFSTRVSLFNEIGMSPNVGWIVVGFGWGLRWSVLNDWWVVTFLHDSKCHRAV